MLFDDQTAAKPLTKDKALLCLWFLIRFHTFYLHTYILTVLPTYLVWV